VVDVADKENHAGWKPALRARTVTVAVSPFRLFSP
jgi:hypothetical protein